MTDLCRLIFWTLVDLMRSRATLEAEIWVLRQQINVLRRAAPRRQSFGIFDRLIFVGLYRLFPKACDAPSSPARPDSIAAVRCLGWALSYAQPDAFNGKPDKRHFRDCPLTGRIPEITKPTRMTLAA